MDPKKEQDKKTFFKRKSIKILMVIIGLLIIIRIILPYIVLNYANRQLAHMHGYFGHIEDIDIAIYRGAYSIKDIYIHKSDTISNAETELFDAKVVDLSVQWKALLKGRIVGQIKLNDPTLRFTKDKTEPAQLVKDTNYFRQMLNKAMPLDINYFEVINGAIKYVDEGSKPVVNMQMDNAHIIAENLINLEDTALLPASVTATADMYNGSMTLNMKLDPLANSPTFDMNAELKNTELPKLNDFFKAYGKFDVNKGTFGLYTEIAAKGGKFIGYVKPIIKNLDVVGPEDKKDDFVQKFWESAVGTAGVVLRNQKHDQVATKIPLEGTFNKSNANLWYAIMHILRNAFIQAISPSIDQEINISSIKNVPKEQEKKGLFKKIFGPKDKKEENKKKKK